MSRPLVAVLVSYGSGIIIGYYYQLPVSLLVCLGALALLAGLFNEAKGWKKNGLCFCFSIVVLGILMSQWQFARHKGNIESLAGKKVVFAGTVSAEPDVRLNATNYTVELEELCGPEETGESFQGRVLVSVIGPAEQYSYGDCLQVAGLPEIPKEPGNPGEFNYRTYLQGKGIQLIVKSRQGAGVQKVSLGRVNPVVDLCLKVKRKLMSVIEATMAQKHAGLMEGTLFGSCGRIDARSRNDFALTGVVHILSVSGYHVGLLAAFCLLCGTIFRFNRTGENILIVLVTFCYAVMTGASPPVVRAVIMAWVLLLARSVRQDYDWPSSLSLAALLILLFDPHALFNPGFQLSFAATWGILYLSPLIKQFLSFQPHLGLTLAITLAAQIAIFPITSFYYNYFSLVSLPANLVIIPLVSLVMLLGGFSAFTGLLWLPLAEITNISTGLVLDIILRLARFLAGLPFAVVTVKQLSPLAILGFYAVLIGAVETARNPELRLRVRRFWTIYRKSTVLVILAVTVVLLWTSIVYPGQEKLTVTFLDIGQGDAVLIESPEGRSIVLDTGGVEHSGMSAYNPGEKVLVPFLRRQGIGKIDLLLLSHAHADHIQGAEALLANNLAVRMLAISPQFCENPDGAKLMKSFQAQGTDIRKMTEGEQILFDEDITLEVLNPAPGTVTDENNDSLVVRLGYRELHILFTGDAGESVLQKLAGRRDGIHAEIIKVPHHGSKSGWLEQFYRSANPKMAVISVGSNCFGHPSGEVLEGLSRLDIPVFRTDQNGAVIIRSDGSGYEVETGRKQRFWEED